MKKEVKITIIVAIIAVLLVGVFVGVMLAMKKPAEVGAKAITIVVVHKDKTEKTFNYKTDAVTLGELVKEKKLASGTDSEFGIMIDTVDGETADSAKEEWWCITKGGEMLMTGADSTNIADGEQYEFTLTVGW